MPLISIVDAAGAEHVVQATPGLSVMRVIRDNGLDDVIGLCGGNCACGTCHVLIDPAFADRIAPMDDDEADVLDMTECRQPDSRLSCQITVTDALDGLRVTIAADD